jgi:hypothetical protein
VSGNGKNLSETVKTRYGVLDDPVSTSRNHAGKLALSAPTGRTTPAEVQHDN